MMLKSPRWSCRYLWVLLRPEMPLIWALGTSRDDLCDAPSINPVSQNSTRRGDLQDAESINPFSQNQHLCSVSLPSPQSPAETLSGFFVRTTCVLWKWNRKVADYICMSRMLILPRLGWFLPASGIKRDFHFCSNPGFMKLGTRSWWEVWWQCRPGELRESLCPRGLPLEAKLWKWGRVCRILERKPELL